MYLDRNEDRKMWDEAAAEAKEATDGLSVEELRERYPEWLHGVLDGEACKVVTEKLRVRYYRDAAMEVRAQELEEMDYQRDKTRQRAKRNAERREWERRSDENGSGVIKLSFRVSNIRKEPDYDYKRTRSSGWQSDRISNQETARTVAEVLNELGIDTTIEVSRSDKTADVTLVVPSDPDRAKRLRTRNAGRRKAYIDPSSSKYPEINYSTTWKEFLEWAESHKASECAEALGLSRSAYYRRLPEIRKRVSEDRGRNARSRAKGESEWWSTINGPGREVPPEEWRKRAEDEKAGPRDGDTTE